MERPRGRGRTREGRRLREGTIAGKGREGGMERERERERGGETETDRDTDTDTEIGRNGASERASEQGSEGGGKREGGGMERE